MSVYVSDFSVKCQSTHNMRQVVHAHTHDSIADENPKTLETLKWCMSSSYKLPRVCPALPYDDTPPFQSAHFWFKQSVFLLLLDQAR